MNEANASVESATESAESPLDKAGALNSLALSLRDSDTNRARSLAESALQIVTDDLTPAIREAAPEATLLKSITAQTHLTLSGCDWKLSHFTTALEHGNRALELFKELQDGAGIGQAQYKIGIIFKSIGDYEKALEHLQHSLELTADNSALRASCLMGIGTVYERLGNYSLSLDYLLQSHTICEAAGDQDSASMILNTMGMIYKNVGDFLKAAEIYTSCIELHRKSQNKRGLAFVLNNLASLQKETGEHAKSLKSFKDAAALFTEIGHTDGIATTYNNIGEMYVDMGDHANARKYFKKSIALFKEIGNISGMTAVRINLADSLLKTGLYREAEKLLKSSIPVLKERNIKPYLFEVYRQLSEVYEKQQKGMLALQYYRDFHLLKEEVFNEKNSQAINELRKRHELSLIQKEQEITGNLLLKILPASIAERLKRNENPIANHCENITVMFADISGFTALCERVSADQLVILLNSLFTYFDSVMQKYGIEKIKTIGDSYMAVAGALTERDDHCEVIAEAALEILSGIHENIPAEFSGINVHMGIHTGCAISGVVGRERLAFDLWGDTINIAARMEAYGEPGKIHCTKEIFLKLNDRFEFTDRGRIMIKGKGMMRTYFLTNKKADS